MMRTRLRLTVSAVGVATESSVTPRGAVGVLTASGDMAAASAGQIVLLHAVKRSGSFRRFPGPSVGQTTRHGGKLFPRRLSVKTRPSEARCDFGRLHMMRADEVPASNSGSCDSLPPRHLSWRGGLSLLYGKGGILIQ